MEADERKTVQAFVEACRELDRRGLLRCSSGNMSWRLDEGRMLTSRTRSWLGRLTPEDVAVCVIADGASLNGVQPTVEARFHAGILRRRPEVNAVLHYQAPFSTLLACQDPADVNYDVIPEIPFYIGPIGRVPFLMPGTEALADAVVSEMAAHDLVQMANHGQVAVAADFAHALQNAEFFELACRIIVELGGRVRLLPEEAVQALAAGKSI